MATRSKSIGVDHPTVVPSNFESESERCPVCGTYRCECRSAE